MFKTIAGLLNAKPVEKCKKVYETGLYVPSFDNKEKEYKIFDTVERAYLANLRANCVNVK